MLEAVVADASPLILLGRVDRLYLLRAISREVLVPGQVIAEIDAKGSGDPSVKALARAPWILRLPPAQVTAEVAAWRLGKGESSVIAVALERGDAIAVVDDRQARRCAIALGIPSFGTVGVVMRAKTAGAIPVARPVLEALVKAGMYLTPEILEAALRGTGE